MSALTRKGRRIRRIHDIEHDLPPRVRKEPKPGDNPLKRPYVAHCRDIHLVDSLLATVEREIPNEFSERDQRTITRPQGVLYFHVLDLQNVNLSKKDFIRGAPFCIYVEYECQGVIKCSYPVHTHKFDKIRIDHSAHFSANISEVRADEANDFVIHVYAFQDPEKHWLLGSQLLHLYNFVRDIHGVETIGIQDDLSYYAGQVTFEFAWAYGAYGYGHSNQLRNTKNPVFETVAHSMFPRIAPNPNDLIDNNFRTRVPKRLHLVNLHSLLVRVPLKKGKDANKDSKSLVFQRVKFARGRPVHCALHMDIHQKFMENDFNQSYGEFICLRNRRERLEHLTRMVEGRLRDRFEVDATELYHPLKDTRTCRLALSTKKPLACPPGYLEYLGNPQHCSQNHPVKLTAADEGFISSITSAPRFSGYLATVFGYNKNNPKDKAKPVEEFEYKVGSHAALGGGERETDSMTLMQVIQHYATLFWYRTLLHIRHTYDFIFPALSAASELEVVLPEISVTLPSPADSTTEFYAHCVQEKVYPKLANLTEAKRKAISLVRISRRKTVEDDEISDDAEWVTEGEEEVVEGHPYNYPPRAKWMTVKKPRDIRALEHVEVTQFGTQHVRPDKLQKGDFWGK